MTNVDYAVLGEGEITTVELIKALKNNENIDSLEGIVHKKNGHYIKNNDRAVISDINSIAFPDYDSFGMDEYLSNQYTNDIYFMYKDDEPRNFSMIMGRSCPYSCNFCFHPLGNKYRQRSLDNFFEELDIVIAKYKINSLSIYDELFSSNKQRVYDFCVRIKPYKLKWIVQMRVDIIEDELLKAMKDAGCYYISYGIESFSDKILLNMKKKINKKDIEKALELTYKNEIGIQGNFIFGDEMEDWDTFNETMAWWRENRKYQLNINFIIALPGTQLYKNAIKTGRIPDSAKFIKDGCPIINLTSLPDEDFNNMMNIVSKESKVNPIKGEVISIKEQAYRTYTMKLKCYHCGHENTIKNIYIDSKIKDISNFKMGCRNCNRKSSYDLSVKTNVML